MKDTGDFLILPSSMIDKRTGRNAGTFSGDAWTPVYPQIERQFSGDGSGRVRDAISRLPQEMQPDVRSAWNNYMDGRDEGSAFAYQFLYERGEAPEFRKVEPLFGNICGTGYLPSTRSITMMNATRPCWRFI